MALPDLVGIGIFLFLNHVFQIGYEVYNLSLSTALSSSKTIYHGQFAFNIQVLELPLYAVLFLEGIPQAYQLCLKIAHGDVGVDLKVTMAFASFDYSSQVLGAILQEISRHKFLESRYNA
jgi:hypothetical protein